MAFGKIKSYAQQNKDRRNRLVGALRLMRDRLTNMAADHAGEDATVLREALEPRAVSETLGYSLEDLLGHVAKDIAMLRQLAAVTKDSGYNQAARSLASFVAHERVGLTIPALARKLGIKPYEAGRARRHAHITFAGAAVTKAVRTRFAIATDTVAHICGFRVRHDVVRVREASMRNAVSCALLERTMSIPKLYTKYKQECTQLIAEGKLSKMLGERTFAAILSSAIFCDPKAESACCEICNEFMV